MADAKALATQAAAAYLTGGASLAGGGISGLSGGATAAPVSTASRSGDAALSFGGFGGVSIGGGKSETNTLYIALAAVAGIALLALMLLRR